MSPDILSDGTGELEPLPHLFVDGPFWKYRIGALSSEPRRMIGSENIVARSENGIFLRILHLFLDGSSQWMLGRNATSRANIIQLDENVIALLGPDKVRLRIKLIDHDYHLWFPKSMV